METTSPAQNRFSQYLQTTFRQDFLASLVVMLVAIPLGLGIALASGAPIIAGLIACAVGGIVAGVFGGAPLQVTGPAAGLTVIMFATIEKFGWPVTLSITIAAGVVQLILGAMRISRTCLAISPAVVHGMLAGIGIVIALAQLHVVLGGSPNSSAVTNLRELPGQIAGLHGHAAILGLITLSILIGWQYLPKKVQAVPGALVAILTATLVSNFAWFDVARVQLPEQLFQLSMPAIPSNWVSFAGAVVTIALVASVESLLCAVATDKLHNAPRANLDKELKAQGLANMASGVLGGLPVTGVIVRSAANISAGARTRASAIMHGVWILLFVAVLGSMLERIPLAALAALLVFVGVKLVNMHHIRQLSSHREATVYYITVFGVAFVNLLAGVGMGIAAAILLLLRRLATTDIRLAERNGRYHVRIDGTLTFISVPKMSAALARIPSGSSVDVDLGVDFMDHAAFEALHSWRVGHEATGGSVDIDEEHEGWYSKAASGSPRAADPIQVRVPGLNGFLNRRPVAEVNDLLQGFLRFRNSAGRNMKGLFSKLGEGQSPKVLLLSCADSRFAPHYLTASKPGDLFQMRNIGNMVPRCDAPEPHLPMSDNSIGAAAEFAIGALGIRNIIVCGHSSCGAMKALLTTKDGKGDFAPSLGEWLKNGSPSLHRFMKEGDNPEYAHLSFADRLSQINVLQQLDNLREYPYVRESIERGDVQLFGWWFDIANAQIYGYSEEAGRFLAVDEATIDLLATRPVAHPFQSSGVNGRSSNGNGKHREDKEPESSALEPAAV